MPKSSSLKRSLAVFGLSVSAAFNIQAADALVTLSALPITAVTVSKTDLDQKLIDALIDANTYVLAKYSEPGKDFDASSSPGLQNRIDNLKAIINAGANLNLATENALTSFGTESPTIFGAVILLAATAQRPDLVQTLMDKGADLRLRTGRGWGPMDYAIAALRKAQQDPYTIVPSLHEIEAAVKIIKMLDSAGLRTIDATALTAGTQANTKNYATLGTVPKTQSLMSINDFVLRSLLHKHGLMTDKEFETEIKGDTSVAQGLLNSSGITTKMVEAAGGNIYDMYDDALPGGTKAINVSTLSTLLTVAQRFGDIMGARDAEDALKKIAEFNNITITPETARQFPEKKISLLIPIMPQYQLGYTKVDKKDNGENETIFEVAERIKNIYYKQNLDADKIAAEIADMNNIPATQINDRSAVSANQQLVVGYINDIYNLYNPMTPPATANANRKVDLFVIEASFTEDSRNTLSPHVKDTYHVAAGINYAINRKVDFNRTHPLEDFLGRYPVNTSNALKVLLNIGNPDLRDRVILSASERPSLLEKDTADTLKSILPRDNVNYEGMRLLLKNVENAKPTIFTAAGNFRNLEGRYVQSNIVVHSPRSIIVGAFGKYANDADTTKTIAPYTNFGADVCARLPVQFKKQMEGTSFSTPALAALMRQFNEWYGDRLSYEEIMAAGLMTADRNLFDFDNPKQVDAKLENFQSLSANDSKAHKATFNTNGAGLPHNDYCGAGAIDPVTWKAALDKMLLLKAAGQDAIGKSITINTDGGVKAAFSSNGQQEYVYRMRVPEAMTLGRLTFLLPQNRNERGDVFVKTPAGFEMQLPQALTDVISTNAFAYEDVKAGDFIEIRSNFPLGSSAGIILRGHAPGNAIALLRDVLSSEGKLPGPLKKMEGNTETGPSILLAPKIN